MDLTIKIEDFKLNIRTAGIIIHNNKILAHVNTNEDHYALIGGRVQIGEDSETALKREIMEEMGKEIEITGYIGTIENFFEMKSEKYHEIMFIHKIEFVDDNDKKIEETIKNIEGKEYLEYRWLELDKIEQYPLRPEVAKEILKNRKYPVHKINIEIKE
jgi:ADP-ribose pyrophosphatase YjhB (NUDIX family)